MVFEHLVALQVTDEESYQKYREGMFPILRSYGGSFSYDFRVSGVLKAETDAPINRVFCIYFPDEPTSSDFFSDERYLEVRKTHFERAVEAVTEIARYNVDRNTE